MQYDNQKLIKYLLGELSDSDSELFDEASFADARFAEDLSAAENDLIDAYLQNELNDAERETFETIYLATEHRREKVDFALSLQAFAEKNLKNNKQKKESAGFFGSWNIFKKPALQFGFVATLVISFLGIFWFVIFRQGTSNDETAMQKTPTPQIVTAANENTKSQNNSSNRENNTSAIKNTANNNLPNNTQKQAETNQKTINTNSVELPKTPENEIPATSAPKPIIASFFLLPPLRNATNIPLFKVPKSASQINIGLQLEADEYKTYHVTLTNETGDINLWRRGSLKAKTKGESKILNIVFPAKLLNKGFYSLTVSGINNKGEAEIIANYPFRVGDN